MATALDGRTTIGDRTCRLSSAQLRSVAAPGYAQTHLSGPTSEWAILPFSARAQWLFVTSLRASSLLAIRRAS